MGRATRPIAADPFGTGDRGRARGTADRAVCRGRIAKRREWQVDHSLVKRLRQEVGDRLAEQRRLDAANGIAADDLRGRAAVRPRAHRPGPGGVRARRDQRGPPPAQRRGGGAARRGRARRAVRRRPAPAAARGPRDRERRHQRLRPGLHRLRRRPRGHGRAGRRVRRGAGRADPDPGGLQRAVQPPVRLPPTPSSTCGCPTGHGCRRSWTSPYGPRCRSGARGSARSSWPTWSATARSAPEVGLFLRGGRGRAQEHHDRGGDQRREDHAAAGDRQRDPADRAAHHRRARAGAGPRPVPRAAPQRASRWRSGCPTPRARARSRWPSSSAARCA